MSPPRGAQTPPGLNIHHGSHWLSDQFRPFVRAGWVLTGPGSLFPHKPFWPVAPNAPVLVRTPCCPSSRHQHMCPSVGDTVPAFWYLQSPLRAGKALVMLLWPLRSWYTSRGSGQTRCKWTRSERCGRKRGHILTLTRSGEACTALIHSET